VLRRTNAWDRVCVVSFSASRLRATRRALGRPVCMAASPFGTAMVRFGGPRGRRDRGGPGQQGPRQPARPRPQRPLADWLSRTGVRCAQVPASMATESFIGRAQALGLQVHAWTVNDRPAMERLLDLGIDGIMTDETVALRDVLAARHQWHPRHPAGQQ
jgi:glycerophosphoryl diester phosphodiesterase